MEMTTGWPLVSRRTLEDDLRQAGLPILPYAKCQELKKAKLAEFRQGIWRYLWPVALAMYFVLASLARTANYLVLMVGVSIVGMGCELGAASFGFAVPRGINALFVSTFLVGVISLGTMKLLKIIWDMPLSFCLVDASFYWASTSAESYQRLHGVTSIPEHLRARAKTAGEIPGTKVKVEYLGGDPLLYTQRRFQKCYIGAWYTHSELDEM